MIVPYVVVRSNNLPLETLNALTRSEQVEGLASEIAGLRGELALLREPACEQLYLLASQDSERYRTLIDLKRRLQRDSPIPQLLERHGAMLDTLPSLQDWTRAARRLMALEQALDNVFESELTLARRCAQSLADQPCFRHATAFTRGQIAASVTDYIEGRRFEDKKTLNDEETVYRYLTRAVTKASPFSSFTSIGFARLAPDADRQVRRNRDIGHRYSYDRATLLKLYERFVIRHKHYWSYRLTANQIEEEDSRLMYLFMDRADVYPYRTSFAKTRLPAGTEALHAALGAEWLSWPQLDAMLPIAMDRDALVAKWINAGLLNYTPHLNEQARDLVSDFLLVAEQVAAGDEAARPVVDGLRRVQSIYGALHEAEASTLPALTEAINAELQALAQQLGYRPIKTSGLVYHDSYLDGLSTVDQADIGRFASQTEEFLHGYLGCNFRDGFHHDTLATLRAALPPGVTVSVFAFHDIAQRCLAVEASSGGAGGAQTALLALYAEVWRRRDETLIQLAPRALPEVQPRKAFAAYGHVVGRQFVLNNIDSGFLRCFSRFFAFTDDPAVLDECRAAYGDALDGAHDFYDTFGFNTACRPRICRGRVWLDRAESPTEHDVALADLDVVWPEDQAYPSLRNRRDGQAVTLRHTALFISSLYPRLLETLLRFASVEEPCYFAFRFGLYKLVADHGQQEVIRFPRVCYRDLVLSREQWWIPKAQLPQRMPGEASASYFRRIDSWRREAGLPQRVFVRRHQLSKVLDRDISNSKKPLFLDFSAPIMSRMIGRVFNTGFDYLSVEEMLPDHQHDFVSDGDRHYASEIIFEQASAEERPAA